MSTIINIIINIIYEFKSWVSRTRYKYMILYYNIMLINQQWQLAPIPIITKNNTRKITIRAIQTKL